MLRNAKWVAAIIVLVILFSLLSSCSDASAYVQKQYSLVGVQGNGKSVAKTYSAEGKDVPTTAKDLAAQEKPKEMSKESTDQMFLVYSDKVINLKKDPQNEANTLVEIDTIEYARQNYDSSFLQGYLTASLLQSLFGGAWNGGNTNVNRNAPQDNRTYSSPKPTANVSNNEKAPTTSERNGSFGTGTKPSTSIDSTNKSGTSSGTAPKAPAPAKPNTSSRGGSFSSKK